MKRELFLIKSVDLHVDPEEASLEQALVKQLKKLEASFMALQMENHSLVQSVEQATTANQKRDAELLEKQSLLEKLELDIARLESGSQQPSSVCHVNLGNFLGRDHKPAARIK